METFAQAKANLIDVCPNNNNGGSFPAMSPKKKPKHHPLKSKKSWRLWLLYVIVPSIVVFFHFKYLLGSEISSSKGIVPIDDGSGLADAKYDDGTEYAAPLRSFIDPVWSEWGHEDGQYETLIPPSEIDYSIRNRLPWEQTSSAPSQEGDDAPNPAAENKCSDILVFMPQMFARNGHGSQLNSYLLAAMVSTFLGKAMVVLEAPLKYTKYPNGSQFGCPIDAFKNPEEFLNFKGNDHSELEMKEDFPGGIMRLISHPEWLSRGCKIPKCEETFDYMSWDAIRKGQSRYYTKGRPPRAISCMGETGEVKVTVVGGEELRQFFNLQYKKRMLQRSGYYARQQAHDWAVRLGATDYQAMVFSKLTKETEIWDYVSALIARSGLVTFRPWIVRDVKAFIQGSDLPLDKPHDAIHVRRGDKLAFDARDEVVTYWHSQGYERQNAFPLNYIPFTHYLRLWGSECASDWDEQKKAEARTIYLATDDPETVKKEIEKLPKGQNGTTIIGGCARVKFVFSPQAQQVSYHINDGGVRIDCVERYQRNIHSIADLMILTKSNTFVGEFNSNWGRIVRIFRMQLNDMYVLPDHSFSLKKLFGLGEKEEGHPRETHPVLIHDTRIAFAEDKAVPPPGW